MAYPIQEGVVVVISEYDCVECLHTLKAELGKQDESRKVYGIFYHVKPFYGKEFSHFMNHISIQME